MDPNTSYGIGTFNNSITIPGAANTNEGLQIEMTNKGTNDHRTNVSPLSNCSSADLREITKMTISGSYLEGRFCGAVSTLVRKCTRDHLWGNTKFLTDDMLQAINIDESAEESSGLLRILLNETKFKATTYSQKMEFWLLYSGVVQKELNQLKSTCGRKVKEELVKGKMSYVLSHFSIIQNAI